jgi:cytochrome c-type biogenesis protein
VNISLNFIRGMVAAVNPCGFVLLPTYLFYFLGISNRTGQPTGDPAADRERASVRRALVVSAAVSAGFMVVFLVIGFVTEQLTTWILTNAKYATAVIGVAFIVLGIAMLFGYRLPIATPKLDAGGRDRTVGSMFVYGIAYAIASLGCTLPLFMTSVMFGASRVHGVAAALANVLAYGFGMALLVTGLTVALAFANVGLLAFLRNSLKYVEMIAGAFVLMSGAYLLWYFWWTDVREESDPITDAVKRYQVNIQVFLNDHWQPVAIVGVVGIVAAIGWSTRQRSPRHRGAE